jgi:hypothetical protein
MIPSNKDLEKRSMRINGLEEILDSNGKLPENKQMQMLRGAIRQAWMYHPVKLLKIEEAAEPDYDESNRRKWKIQCAKCKRWFMKSQVEVDHIDGGHSLKSMSDLLMFCHKILNVSTDDLQILCKGCHGIKTYQEKHVGMSWESASIEKRLIQWLKKPARAQRKDLSELGRLPEDSRNPEQRKAAYRQYLIECDLKDLGYE